MDVFGDVLYNLYGSTEVAWATIATPADLRGRPGHGRAGPRSGTVVKLLDEQGREVPQGQTGRIFVGNEMVFEGYTGGGGKEIVDGLHEHGRRGAPGRRRAPVRGRARRRNDRQRRGERRSRARWRTCSPTTSTWRRSRWSASRTTSSASACVPFVVARPGRELSESDVQAHVRANLARFKVPREVVFLERLPRNATGKVVKRELQDDG